MPNDPLRQRRARTRMELDQLAEVSPSDVDRAVLLWKRDAPAQFRNLLDAEPVNTEPEQP